MNEHFTIIGAGVAGLSLAHHIQTPGLSITILEKSRGVGGRCATRRIDDLPVDHGVPFLHGSSRPFLDALDQLDEAQKLLDWPFHLHGDGTPCQPQAYRLGSRRLAMKDGVTAFPKILAKGLDVKLNTKVQEIALTDRSFTLRFDTGTLSTDKLFISCPLPQTSALLSPLADKSKELHALLKVFERVTLLPCLTVIAGYETLPEQNWQLFLPGPNHPIHSIINDSSKRKQGSKPVLVIQAAPKFSREHLEAEDDKWIDLLLEATAKLFGAWIKNPIWRQGHRWRHARVQRGEELSHPVLLRWPTGQLLGLCGDAFNPKGGVEGAFLSGIELAHRLAHNIATNAVS